MRGRHAAALLAAAAALALGASPAAATDVYWSTTTEIHRGHVDGSRIPDVVFSGQDGPQGIVLDAAEDRIYWATRTAIRVGNLDGTGARTLYAGEDEPQGLAVDFATGRLFWAARTAIRVGTLDGMTAARTLVGDPSRPSSIALDLANERLYYSDYGTGDGSGGTYVGSVNRVNLDGTGRTSVSVTGYNRGVALDADSNRLYWVDAGLSPNHGAVRMLDLNSRLARDLFTGLYRPAGIAADAGDGRLYWAEQDTSGTNGAITSGLASGLPPARPQWIGQHVPAYPALMTEPLITATPTIGGTPTIGSTLTCDNLDWANDAPGAFLFRAARSVAIRWQRDGVEVPGATGTGFAPDQAGSYTCRLTVTNRAGASERTSDPVVVSGGLPAGAGGGGAPGDSPSGGGGAPGDSPSGGGGSALPAGGASGEAPADPAAPAPASTPVPGPAAAPTPARADAAAPRITRLSLSSHRVRPGRPPLLHLAVDRAATVRVTLLRARHGHRSGGRCRLGGGRHRRGCVRWVKLHRRIARRLAAGERVALRLPRGLAPGRYRARVVAVDGSGDRTRRRAGFAVRRR